jgi:hypothetical protein
MCSTLHTVFKCTKWSFAFRLKRLKSKDLWSNIRVPVDSHVYTHSRSEDITVTSLNQTCFNPGVSNQRLFGGLNMPRIQSYDCIMFPKSSLCLKAVVCLCYCYKYAIHVDVFSCVVPTTICIYSSTARDMCVISNELKTSSFVWELDLLVEDQVLHTKRFVMMEFGYTQEGCE